MTDQDTTQDRYGRPVRAVYGDRCIDSHHLTHRAYCPDCGTTHAPVDGCHIYDYPTGAHIDGAESGCTTCDERRSNGGATVSAADVLRLAHAWGSPDDWNVPSIYVSTLDQLVARAVAGESIDSLVRGATS